MCVFSTTQKGFNKGAVNCIKGHTQRYDCVRIDYNRPLKGALDNSISINIGAWLISTCGSQTLRCSKPSRYLVSAPFSSPDYQSVAPLHFCCPLDNTIMENPVNLESGITYERSAIEKWFESGNTTCPVKKCELTTRHLIPNHNLRELIQEWKENNAKFRLENAAETLVSSGGGDGEEIEAALVELCNLCQERSSFSQIVEDKNLIPRILALTSFQLESIQLKSMECLCYIARQDSSKVRAFLVCAKILEHGKAGPES